MVEQHNNGWDISKESLKNSVLQASRGVMEKFESAQPGEIFVRCSLSANTSFAARRAIHTPGLLLNVFYGDEEAGQMELRPEKTCWNIADRQSNRGFTGRGIFGALLAACEQCVTELAERRKTPQRIEVNTGQPSVFSAFEHHGYKVQSDYEDAAAILRHPDRYVDTVVVRHAFVPARGGTGEMIERTHSDPFCFRKDVLMQKPKPEVLDAIRATLVKIIPVATGMIIEVSDATRPAVDEVMKGEKKST